MQNLKRPQVFKKKQLNNIIDRKTWKTADKVGFYRHKKLLECCPYVHSFYIIEDKSSTVTNEEASKNDKECGESSYYIIFAW